MDWRDRGATLKETHSWTELYKAIRIEYPELKSKTDGQIRDGIRYKIKKRTKPQEQIDIHETLKKLLQKEQPLKNLVEATKHSERMVLAAIEDIKDEGIQITEIDGRYKICRNVVAKDNLHKEDWQGNKIIRFGSVSDTHMCSKWQQLTHLNTMYDIFKREGIETVYHAGDITEGVNMRQGHQYEVFRHGTDEQQQYVIDNYPKRKGMITKFITGNHDHSGIKSAGHDIGIPIGRDRDDMIYLGMSNAKVELTPKCILELNHPLDGACFDDKTEILTQKGWVFFNELTTEDSVATMTKSKHEFQWQNPKFITEQHYKGNLYHITARLIDMMVTPNHGLWVRRSPITLNRKADVDMPQKSHIRVNSDWHMETAEEVCKTKFCRQRWQMTNACDKWEGVINSDKFTVPYIESKNKGMASKMVHVGEVDLMDFCELVAWYVTEGYADKKRVSICQSKVVNPDCHKKITDLLDRMNLPYGVSGREDKNICVGSVELAHCLIDLCGSGSREKFIPSFLKDLPRVYLEKMFDTMILGDGWYNGKAFGYKSISQKLRDSMTEIAIKLGYSVTEHKDTVNIAGIQTQPTINVKPREIEYDGMVYCCKVPNELILVRRNGRATWSHNSYALSYTLQKTIDAMSGGEKPNILINGHHHKMIYLFYRNIHAIEAATFQSQTAWMRGKRLPAHMGGWIYQVHVDDEGTIQRCGAEFFPFYKAIENDY